MANKVSFKVLKREKSGKGSARAVRRNGLIPAVIYGNKQEPELISIEPKLLLKQMEIKGFKTRQFELEIEGQSKTELALCQDIQFHKVKDNPIHVDFLRIDVNKEISIEIPFKFIGEDVCVGVKKGGALNIIRRVIAVRCKPADIVDQIEVDISKLDITEVIHLKDIKLPKGLIMDESGEFAVATVTSAVGDVKEETDSTSVDVPSATEEKAAAKEDAKK